jgi:hypothetical protein
MKKVIILIFNFSVLICCISCKKSKPSASFGVLVDKKYSPAEIYFKNESQNAEEYFWDFGDGTTSMDQNPVHFFKSEGEYKVVLKAKKNNFRSDEFSQTLQFKKGYTGAKVPKVSVFYDFFITGNKYVVKINQVVSEPQTYNGNFDGFFHFSTPVTLLLDNSIEKLELCKYEEIVNPEPFGPTFSILPITFIYFNTQKELNIEKVDNYNDYLMIYLTNAQMNLKMDWF